MANVYQEGDKYVDAHGNELFYNESEDAFYFSNGVIYDESLPDEVVQFKASPMGVPAKPTAIQNNKVTEDVYTLEAGLPESTEKFVEDEEVIVEEEQQVPLQKQKTAKVKDKKEKPAKKEKPVKKEKTVSPEPGGGEESLLRKIFIENIWLPLVFSVILCWLHAFLGGVAIFLVLNSKKMPTALKVACTVIIMLSAIYTTSGDFLLDRSYYIGTVGADEDIQFVLGIRPGTTKLENIQTQLKSHYTTTVNQVNNSINIQTNTMIINIYLDVERERVNAVELFGNDGYVMRLFPMSVYVETEGSVYVYNNTEINVGILLNALQSGQVRPAEYMSTLMTNQ